MAHAAQIPTSFGHELRACLRCRLIKTYDQFRESGCENCPFFKMDQDHERVVDCTTPNFTGLISVMDPTRSWAARWLQLEGLDLVVTHLQFLTHFQKICRYLTLEGLGPIYYVNKNLCEDEHVPYVRQSVYELLAECVTTHDYVGTYISIG